MEVTVMADTLSLTQHHLSLTDTLQISSIIFPIDSVAPPPVRSTSSSCRTAARRTLLKRRRRTRRRSHTSDSGEDDAGFFAGGDDSGFFGGGRGWNFDGSGGGGFNWGGDGDSSSGSYPDDPAFDFVYEIVCWIVFSNCLHFAFEKVVRLVAEDREKVPVSVC